MTVERHFNFFEIKAYVSKYKCKNAKEALDWLAMYNSAMSEDKPNYNPHVQRPFSFWTDLCPEISYIN